MMNAKRVLYIGGTGTISAACVRRSLHLGHDVTVLNRGSGRRTLPEGVRELIADVRDAEDVRSAIGGEQYDVVAEFLAFTTAHVQADLDQFEGRCGQYVFISSASAYQKPPQRLPITESTPLRNPFWEYSRNKIACELLLTSAYRDDGFPVTIVRGQQLPKAPDEPTMVVVAVDQSADATTALGLAFEEDAWR